MSVGLFFTEKNKSERCSPSDVRRPAALPRDRAIRSRLANAIRKNRALLRDSLPLASAQMSGAAVKYLAEAPAPTPGPSQSLA
ncbi:hypothetical protein EYF80_003606 [Liparis tanakae]|uniref:Uncharacterized protein n=1 Tax=Liparis tanakae TaxID=230148 RepID=A0A4Z2J7M8_9TELE|nr:hypothetical protein EYF80_003606 [Liparis tanakae]